MHSFGDIQEGVGLLCLTDSAKVRKCEEVEPSGLASFARHNLVSLNWRIVANASTNPTRGNFREPLILRPADKMLG